MVTTKDQQTHQKRILISGAGPIGLSFALGLKNSPLNITVIDQKERPSKELLEQDTRMIALSHRSVSFLKSIDLWAELKTFATPIERVEISEKGYATKVELEAFDHDLQDFGALIPLGRLVLGMLKAVDTCDNITYLDQTQLSNYQLQNVTNAGDSASTATSASCTLLHQGEKRTETFDWIVAAEGLHSQLRMLSGIESYHSDYNQVAVIARATFEYPHHNTAYERFTSDGPLALLPVGSHEMAVVLIADRTEKEKWKNASDAVFSNEVIYRIGLDLGEIQSVTKRHVWDLSLMVPKEVSKPCLTLIGNSAHSLHPIAGQGLNLGFRDCELLLPYFKNGNIPTIFDLERYARERRHDVVKVAGATDFLVRGFGIELPGASQLRNLALKSVNFIKPLKKRIAKFGMGY
ncbi:FAD-dependent monooxygenase [Ignatzschineria sp. LJL83]